MLEQKFKQFWNLLTNPELMIPILHIFMTKNILVTKGGTLWIFRPRILWGELKDLTQRAEIFCGKFYEVLKWENAVSQIKFQLKVNSDPPSLHPMPQGL